MSIVSDESDSSLSDPQTSSKILMICYTECVYLCFSWLYNKVWELTYELYSFSIAFFCFIVLSNSFFKSELLFTIDAQFSHSTTCNVIELLFISSTTGANLPWLNWWSVISVSWTWFILTLSSLTQWHLSLVTNHRLGWRLTPSMGVALPGIITTVYLD